MGGLFPTSRGGLPARDGLVPARGCGDGGGDGTCAAKFSYEETSPDSCTFQFTDETTVDGDVAIQSWLWDFGDGTTSTQQNPLHSFPVHDPPTAEDEWDVLLTVTLENGEVCYWTSTVSCAPLPNPGGCFAAGRAVKLTVLDWPAKTNPTPCPGVYRKYDCYSASYRGEFIVPFFQWIYSGEERVGKRYAKFGDHKFGTTRDTELDCETPRNRWYMRPWLDIYVWCSSRVDKITIGSAMFHESLPDTHVEISDSHTFFDGGHPDGVGPPWDESQAIILSDSGNAGKVHQTNDRLINSSGGQSAFRPCAIYDVQWPAVPNVPRLGQAPFMIDYY